MNLRAVNLNLLPILRALLRDRGVLQAARSLSMSPSATSEALGRLRVLLGDELLVQVGRSMHLTPRAEELIEPVERLSIELQEVLRPTAFAPATLQRTFVIASLDFVALAVATTLLAELRHSAPDVGLEFVDATLDMESRIIAGEIDFALVSPQFWITPESNKSLHALPLPSDRFVAMFSPQHPLAASPSLTTEELSRYPHIGFRLNRRHGEHPQYPLDVQTSLRVQNHLLMPMLLDSRHIALTPRLFTQQIRTRLPVEVRELPNPMGYQLCMYWSPAQHKDGGHRWFRQQLATALSTALLDTS